MRSFKTILLALSFLLSSTLAYSQVKIGFWGDTIRQKKAVPATSGLNKEQEVARLIGLNYSVPDVDYGQGKPKFWTLGLLDEFIFSQVHLENWAAGGSGSVALSVYANAMANYQKGKIYWENRAQLGYGFVRQFDVGYRKSEDKIILDSKWGYQAFRKVYLSAFMNFRSQFSPGFDYNSKNEATMKSKFFAPAYLNIGLGLDWKPGNGKVFSLNFSPLTGRIVMVNADSAIRVRYGNDYDKFVRWELGAQFKATFSKSFTKNFKVATQFSAFSDYMGTPSNIVIYWDVQADYTFNKYFKASFRTNLIYDDKIKITSKSGKERTMVQFKELFGINFAYIIGTYKK